MNEKISSSKEIIQKKLEEAKEHVKKVESTSELKKEIAEKMEFLNDDIAQWKEMIARVEGELGEIPETIDDQTLSIKMQDFNWAFNYIKDGVEQSVKELMEVKEEEVEEVKENKKIEVKEEVKIKVEDLRKSGYILDPGLVEKMAQIESIDNMTLESNPMRHQIFLDQDPKFGINGVAGCQKIMMAAIEGKEEITQDEFEMAIDEMGIIGGIGNVNRYRIDPSTGRLKLVSGVSSTNSSGGAKYYDFLKQKGKEIGLDLEQ